MANTKKNNKIVTRSFQTYAPCIGNLSVFAEIPNGFEDPCSCKAIKCTAASAAKTNGNKKCNEKNRLSVALLTEKPPHTTIDS